MAHLGDFSIIRATSAFLPTEGILNTMKAADSKRLCDYKAWRHSRIDDSGQCDAALWLTPATDGTTLATFTFSKSLLVHLRKIHRRRCCLSKATSVCLDRMAKGTNLVFQAPMAYLLHQGRRRSETLMSSKKLKSKRAPAFGRPIKYSGKHKHAVAALKPEPQLPSHYHEAEKDNVEETNMRAIHIMVQNLDTISFSILTMYARLYFSAPVSFNWSLNTIACRGIFILPQSSSI